MKLQTLRSLCSDIVIILIPILVIIAVFPYVLSILSPFLAGFLLYLTAKPFNERLKMRLPPSVAAFFSLFIFSAIIFLIMKSLIGLLISEISSFTENTGKLYSETIPFISSKTAFLSKALPRGEIFSAAIDAFRTQLFEILTKLSTSILGFAKNIPSMLIYIFVSVFTAFFLLKDSKTFYDLARAFFGNKLYLKFCEMRKSFFDVVISYIKAQLIIEGIIFVLLFSGLLLLGQSYSLLTALFAAIIDSIPVLGTGIILVPMAIFNFLSGNIPSGWGIIALYGAAIITRQLCEPKILGSKLGIHPMMTVFSLYAGMKLFGVLGIIFGPIAAILIKNTLCKALSKNFL